MIKGTRTRRSRDPRSTRDEFSLGVVLPPNPFFPFLFVPCRLAPTLQAADISYYSTFLSLATSWIRAFVWVDADKSGSAGTVASLPAAAPLHPRSCHFPHTFAAKDFQGSREVCTQAILRLSPSAIITTPSPGRTRLPGRKRGVTFVGLTPQQHLQNTLVTVGHVTYSHLGAGS